MTPFGDAGPGPTAGHCLTVGEMVCYSLGGKPSWAEISTRNTSDAGITKEQGHDMAASGTTGSGEKAAGRVASVMTEARVFPPPTGFSAQARISSLE